MRVIKLNTTKEFPALEDLERYFDNDLPSRNPPGKFRLTKGRIAEDGLQPGERVIFSYKCCVCFVAYAASGRMENTDEYQNDYPYFFIIDLDHVRQTNFSLQKLEDRLLHKSNEKKYIVRTQGWPRISDTKITESIVESLISSA